MNAEMGYLVSAALLSPAYDLTLWLSFNVWEMVLSISEAVSHQLGLQGSCIVPNIINGRVAISLPIVDSIHWVQFRTTMSE